MHRLGQFPLAVFALVALVAIALVPMGQSWG